MNDPIETLGRYVSDRQGFSWKQAAPGVLDLISGQWKAGEWRHEIHIVEPSRRTNSEVAIIYVTGGDANETDLEEAMAIADRSGLTVAMLFHIPNQPLFEMWEDDLIAHTFERYLDTGDTDWPLLFPMARAVLRAVDALGELGYYRFVVTGASKRGWTTWLAGATGDSRIVGIAPMVIDNLNFPAQMAHQIESWGSYSEQIEDYTSRELQESMGSELGRRLTAMMDPLSYVHRIECPILVVNGANDRYWTVDALSLYWNALPPSKRCLIVPNVGHVLGDKVQMIESLSAFADACSRGELLPTVSASVERIRDRRVRVAVESDNAVGFRVWAAFSQTLDFRDSAWLVVSREESSEQELPTMNVAAMVEALYVGRTGPYSLTTPAVVFKAASDQ